MKFIKTSSGSLINLSNIMIISISLGEITCTLTNGMCIILFNNEKESITNKEFNKYVEGIYYLIEDFIKDSNQKIILDLKKMSDLFKKNNPQQSN